MLSVVLVIGIFNLLLGFAFALAMQRQIVVPYPVFRLGNAKPDVVFEVSAARKAATIDEVRDRLPVRWLEILESMDLEFETLMGASVQVLKLEVGSYREDLLDIEDLVRRAIASEKPDAVRDAIEELVMLNDEWCARLGDALQLLADCHDQLGEYATVGNQLESVLLDQVAMIQSTGKDLARYDATSELSQKAILRGLCDLARMAHQLRDVIADATLFVICNEERLDSMDRRFVYDESTGLQNRVGIERLLGSWWSSGEAGERLASAALIDVDRFNEINLLASTRLGDRILRAIANYLEQLVATDSGLERVFRYSGQRFLIFFADSGAHVAASKIEHIRRTIEASSLECRGRVYSLTVRAGVTEVHGNDNTATLLRRLEGLTESAKHAGRNRTALDTGTGGEIIDPDLETEQCKQQVVKVE